MYLAVILLLMLAFLTLCVIGLFTLIRQAIVDPPFTAPGAFIEDTSAAAALSSAARTSAAPSKDAEGSACGESCA
jgi:hypothetical protein